jgi:hypothetical protein
VADRGAGEAVLAGRVYSGQRSGEAPAMETVRVKTIIPPDGRVRIEVPSALPPGPADVVLTISVEGGRGTFHWRDYYGLGAEIWGEIDAQEYVNRLRDEWRE